MSTSTPTPPPRSRMAKVLAASVAGTTIEFYDFFLYGTAAALVFNKVFFPSSDPLTGILLALVTYAVGFLARPLGGILFGHFGDRYGRKPMLAFSLLLMGGATVCIGLIPSYASIGALAPVLLTLCRLVQGVALGGEWGGAVLLVAEYGSRERRGFWSSWPQAGGPLGNMLSTAVLALLGLGITNSEFVEWGWRIPFLLSAVLVILGLWLRRSVEESPLFVAAREAAPERAPLTTVLREHRRPVAIAALAALGEKATYYTFSIFLLSYLAEQVKAPKSVGLTAITIASAFQVVAMLAGGAFTDRFGRRVPSIVLACVIGVWAFVGLPFVDSGAPVTVTVVVTVGLVLHGLLCGAQGGCRWVPRRWLHVSPADDRGS
ncbi:MFS transporter [Streptomyces spiroverticillatus]